MHGIDAGSPINFDLLIILFLAACEQVGEESKGHVHIDFFYLVLLHRCQ